MKPTQDKYPFFEANQVLTNAHLNQAINYLDEQERLTRANLIGIGIVCGLEIKYENPNISISKGCGISSEGYLITAPSEVKLLSSRKYTPPAELAYPPFAGKDLWELLPESSGTALSDSFLMDKVVLLFLELTKEGLRNCSPNNCDDKGAAITATVRYLLIDKSNLTDTLPATLPELPLARIAFTTAENLRDYEKVYRDFLTQQTNGKTALGRLFAGIQQAELLLKQYLPNLELFNFNLNLPASPYTPIQYYYDFLRDLTAAYHELVAALSQSVAVCLPDSTYPQHLLLGLARTPNQHYRSIFSPAPAVALPQQRLTELRFLHQRLIQMVAFFQIQTGTVELKITPSRFGFKSLSGKSLPFYYQSTLKPHWDHQPVLSWHDDSTAPDHVRHPLNYDLEPYNFFRIEGHVGKNILNLRKDLADLTQNHRLPISLLYLNADASDNFLEKHPATEHQAGVINGGTFIVLYRGTGTDTNLVLADFALPYRIETQVDKGCLCRVQVKECEFEWFDTKQHLANLAQRAYRYKANQFINTQSVEQQRVLLTAFYVIVIYRYDIQGQSLINNTPVQLKIPIADLISGQLSAIARKLNAQFPSGVVFDYNQTNNKLVIRHFADQTFRIEWGGVQGNQIRYAYTPKSIDRWQKNTWETLYNDRYKVVCHLRDEYHADEYQWLHEDKYYEAKYPSPAQMPTAKELVTWEKMIKQRAKLAIPIQGLLWNIQTVINTAFNANAVIVQVVLIGSWANGTWVSRNSSENNFPTGFVALRKKITGKTGVSDIDLLVDIQPNKSVTIEQVINSINAITKASGYKVNVIAGKKDAQKWRVISMPKIILDS